MANNAIENHHRLIDEPNTKPVVRSLQVLQAGSFRFGIFADDIATIAPWREPTPLPHAPKSVLGVVSIQGRMLTVLDLARLPGCEAASTGTAAHLVALRGDEQLAFAIDAMDGTVEVADSDFENSEEAKERLIAGILNRGEGEISILNAKQLFATAIQGRERRRRRF